MRQRRFALGVVLLAVGATLIGTGAAADQGNTGNRPPACAEPGPGQEPPAPEATTLTTVAQAYYCIFDNHFSGPVLDSRTLLVPAFAAVTQELQRRGIDQPDATTPALTGRKDADWAAFSKVYKKIAAALPDDATRQAVAGSAIQAMITALADNHARWLRPSSGGSSSYGVVPSGIVPPADLDPVATQPLHVSTIIEGGPAAVAGLRLGDEILALGGMPLFSNGMLNRGVLEFLRPVAPGTPLQITVHRPVTGETITVTATSARVEGPEPAVTSRLVDGNIAYVSLPGFNRDLVDQVLAAITELRGQADLRGLVLDLRGNGGGSPKAVATLLGALAHGRITSYWCDVRDSCTANRTDDSVALVNLPFVELTDRNCASACDSFSSTVKDLKLGKIVGTRTAGVVAGPGAGWLLNDGTVLMLPKSHEIGANKEVVNGVGVAPDHTVPLTAADLSAGRDPGLDKAVSLL